MYLLVHAIIWLVILVLKFDKLMFFCQSKTSHFEPLYARKLYMYMNLIILFYYLFLFVLN